MRKAPLAFLAAALLAASPAFGAAKIITDFAKANDSKPAVKGGVFEGKQIDKAQVTKLASMPSREQMLSELGASMQAPMAAFAGAMNGLLTMFAGAVEALRVQREGTIGGTEGAQAPSA